MAACFIELLRQPEIIELMEQYGFELPNPVAKTGIHPQKERQSNWIFEQTRFLLPPLDESSEHPFHGIQISVTIRMEMRVLSIEWKKDAYIHLQAGLPGIHFELICCSLLIFRLFHKN